MTNQEWHDVCSTLAERGIIAGNRVRIVGQIDRYPFYLSRPGELGTVVSVADEMVAIRLDIYREPLAEWGNELHFYIGDKLAGGMYLDELLKQVEAIGG